jgi:HPt (histidine-containing phosphotransfer) domain-containing protein
MKGDREACLAAGMDAFATKPIETARLLEILEDLTSGSSRDSNGESETPDRGEPEALDEVALMKLVAGDGVLAGELAELFLQDLGPRVTEITGAVHSRDATRLGAAAHALRGSAGSLRAGIVSQAAAELESMARSGVLDGVDDALEKLNLALATLRPRLVELAAKA